MARLAMCLAALLAAPAAGFALKGNSSAPITESVTIDSVEVYGKSSGHDSVSTCSHFAASAVSNPAQPVVRVCGTGTKVTVFLRNRCEAYHEYQVDIGSCDKGHSSSTCEEQSPATLEWMQTAQSYMIVTC